MQDNDYPSQLILRAACVIIAINGLTPLSFERQQVMKKGLILINAYYDIPSYLNQAERLKEEFLSVGISADIVKNGELPLVLKDGKVCLDAHYDFCVYLDKDKYTSLMLEKSGMRLFNPHDAVVACDDKMTTYITLADSGIPMPETISGLLCYLPEKQVQKATADRIEKALGYPLIAKESYGSLGKGVYKIDDRNALDDILKDLKLKPHLFQKFIASSCGKDIRVIVIGDKVIAAMERRSESDFRSNIELGGKGEKITPSEKLVDLSVKAARLLGLDYCGIDWLEGEDGNYLLCEVNSNAFFGGIEAVTGVNVAKAYANYIRKTVYGE